MFCIMFLFYLKRKDFIYCLFLDMERGLGFGFFFVLYFFVGILLEIYLYWFFILYF